MSDYTSIAIIGVFVVWFLAYIGWRFIDIKDTERLAYNQAIGLFLILMSFVTLVATTNIAIQIAETEIGIGQDVTDAISFVYSSFVWALRIFFSYLILVLFILPVIDWVKSKNLKWKGGK